jgi:hypothetical protein
LTPLLAKVDESLAATMSRSTAVEIDPRLVTSAVLGTYHWIALRSSFTGTKVDVEETVKHTSRLVERGLTPRSR